MSAKTTVAAVLGVALAAGVAATAVAGVQVHEAYAELDHGEPFQLAAEDPLLEPAGHDVADVDTPALKARLDELAADPALGTFHGVVTDTTTGETVWENNPRQALTPASSTKVLTAAAAILALDPDHRLETTVVEGPHPGAVTLVAGGDVWLDAGDLDDLAAQVSASAPGVSEVFLDTSVWAGEDYLPGWDAGNVDAGYIAPLEPVMINGARIGAETGDVPRSHTPAADVAAALAERLDARAAGDAPAEAGGAAAADGTGAGDAGQEVLATVVSDPLTARLETMMQHSDNVMAEAIGRELAVATGAGDTARDAVRATLAELSAAGISVDGVEINDNSGLSADNLIPPQVLSDILNAAAEGTTLRPLLDTLPVAYGEGTLFERYADLPGRGHVRAKTGTLTGVNALAGSVTGESGRVYTFALLSNDADITAGRRALDRFASALREA